MTGGVCIRNKKSGLVLDMSHKEVTLQHYNGSPSQLWDLEGFLIRSKQNGNVLDVASEAVITYAAHGGRNQQWFFNPDGTISSGVDDLVLDVKGGQLHPGATFCAFKKHGGDNQQFEIVTLKR